MRAIITEYGGTKLWLSAQDTDNWARGYNGNGHWPCSTLAGDRLFAEFDRQGNLVDLAVNGRSGVDVDSAEFDAITSDYLAVKFGNRHPATRGGLLLLP